MQFSLKLALCLGSICLGNRGFPVQPAGADVASFKDDKGVTHFVDNENKVPEKYREQLKNQKELPPISRTKSGRDKIFEKEHYSSYSNAKVEIFVTSWCPYCRKLEDFLKAEKIDFKRYDVETSAEGKRNYEALGGGGIPIVRIGQQVIQGFDPEGIKRALHGTAPHNPGV